MSLRPHRCRARVLFFSHTGTVSGAEHVLLSTIGALVGSDIEAVAVCPQVGQLLTRLEAAGVKTIPIQTLKARFTFNPIALLGYILSFCEIIRSFRKAVKLLAPDVIHANSVRAALVATISTLGMPLRTIWHIQDDLPRHPISTVIRLWAFCRRNKSIFVCVSGATSVAFCGSLPLQSRISVIHNGIDLSRFPPKGSLRSSFRAQYDLEKDAFLICCIGMINPRKNLIGVLKAFDRVYSCDSRSRLVFVGEPLFNKDTAYLSELKQLARELGLDTAVRFVGAQEDIAAVLRACDLLVLNALVEPFGLVLIEAMASGTPVLATRVGGIPEIVEDNLTGFLVSPGDHRLLSNRILDVMRDPLGRRRAAERARLHVEQTFTNSRYNIAYRHLLSRILPQLEASQDLEKHSNSDCGKTSLKVSLFHDNFAQSGGAEKVAEDLYRILDSSYTHTDLWTTLFERSRLPKTLSTTKIHTTWMQHLPFAGKLFRLYFLLYPAAIDRVDLSGYDLVVTSCFGYAKGVRRGPNALHICYCHTPMRWVWRTQDYLSREKFGGLKQLVLAAPIRWLKAWELSAASRPDLYVANSSVVAERLFRAFGVHSTVIHPPINTSLFAPPSGSSPITTEEYYLVISRLVPYKRLELAIEACNQTQRRLIVIGAGPDRKRLERLAGPTVSFLGRAPNEVVIHHAQRCRALIFPGEEDFGMTPLEVNAAGRPVVAYRGGGAVETVMEGLNGVFFDHASPESLITAMDRLESQRWDSSTIQQHAAKYDTNVFTEKIAAFIQNALAQRDANPLEQLSLVTA